MVHYITPTTYIIFISFLIILSVIFYKHFSTGLFKFRKFIPILPLFIILGYFYVKESLNKNNFYKNQIHSNIIRYSDWQIRTTEFYLNKGLRISSAYNKLDLQIGDSISKDANTYIYYVYRKNSLGKFIFHARYDYNQ